jgi:hypothetical protein
MNIIGYLIPLSWNENKTDLVFCGCLKTVPFQDHGQVPSFPQAFHSLLEPVHIPRRFLTLYIGVCLYPYP